MGIMRGCGRGRCVFCVSCFCVFSTATEHFAPRLVQLGSYGHQTVALWDGVGILVVVVGLFLLLRYPLLPPCFIELSCLLCSLRCFLGEFVFLLSLPAPRLG